MIAHCQSTNTAIKRAALIGAARRSIDGDGFRTTVQRYWSRLLLSTIVVFSWPGSAAADIPLVTVTEAGPDRDIPVGAAYYLTGPTGPGVSEVRAVFVRVGTKTLFGATGDSCTVFASHVRTDQFAGASPVLAVPGVGTAEARDVWVGKDSDFDADAQVYVGTSWKPSDTGKEPYKILIPSDAFFSSMGRYCLFVYKTKTTSTETAPAMVNILEDFARAYVACRADPPSTDLGCHDPQSQRDIALANLGATLDPASKQKLDTAANKALGLAVGIRGAVIRLDAILKEWANVEGPAPTPGLTRPMVFDQVRDVATDPLARATVSLLAERQELARVIQPATGYTFYTLDAKTKVEQIQIQSDGQRIGIASIQPGKPPSRFDVVEGKTDTLTFEGMDVSLRDVLEMLRGRVRIGGTYRTASNLRRKLAPLVAAPLTPASDDVSSMIDELSTRTTLLALVIQHSLSTSTRASQSMSGPEASAALGTETATLRELGNWLIASNVLTPCRQSNLSNWRPGSACNMAASGVWPRYGAPGDNPLSFIAGEAMIYRYQAAEWVANERERSLVVDKATTLPASPVLANIQFNQSDWVFSYLTPIVGSTFILSTSETFWLPYVGVQLHIVPNPVDEPLWSKQEDYKRMIALELGMVTGNGPWGPDNRFSGWKGLPPVLAGLSVHPLPYASVSLGLAFLQRRSSTVAQENPSAYLSAYFGLNVQINIPDLVAGLKGRHSDTVTQK